VIDTVALRRIPCESGGGFRIGAEDLSREIDMARKDSRKGKVRCLNCFERFTPPAGAERSACPNCGVEWRLTWSSPTAVKVRGPVWAKLKGQNT
jgi:predicted RNA-binding Zn-ribbon protein involved in translation (DUF1610 family)